MLTNAPHIAHHSEKSARPAVNRLLWTLLVVLAGALLLTAGLAFAAATGADDVATPAAAQGSDAVLGFRLVLGKQAAPDPDGVRVVGDSVVFSITLQNEDAWNPLIWLPLRDDYDPAKLTYVSASPPPTTVTLGVLEWDDLTTVFGGLYPPPNNTATVVVSFTARATGVTTNTATVTGARYQGSPDPENVGPVYASVTIVAVDLVIVKSDGGVTTGPGGIVTYTLNYRNDGVQGATGVVITETVPVNTRFNAAASAPTVWSCANNSPPGTVCTTSIGNLGVGGSGSVRFAVTVNKPLLPGVTQIVNTAIIGDDGANGPDSTPANNISTDNTPVDYGPVPAAVGDYVWYDANGDGYQDVTENGIGNVTLTLWRDVNGNGLLDPITDTLAATTTTDADGCYLFAGLSPDKYLVDVTDANGVLAGLTHPLGPQSQSDPFAVTLAAGQTYRDADFGYRKAPTPGTAVVGDTVWWDSNQNGVLDPGEAGIPGVTVNLVRVSDGAIISTTVTNVNGNYLFTNVVPGTYYVDAVAPPGGADPAAPDPTAPFTVGPGDQFLNADIGRVPAQTAVISGTLFEDINLSGTYSSTTEPGLPGVSVDLIRDTNNDSVWDPDGADNLPGTADDEPIIATTTTDSTGTYTFTVPGGNYLALPSDTTNTLADYTVGPLGPTPGADNNSQQQPYPVKLPAGGVNPTGDFGYVKNDPLLGKLGNQVWVETDRDGVFEPASGENGVEGVTIRMVNSTGQVFTTTTSASGDYVFTGLTADTYTVTVTDQFGVLAGYIPTTYPANQSADNNNKHQPYVITLPAGVENMTADFGYIVPAAVGDYVWYDANGDGYQDVTENGIGNVTLTLWRDVNGNGVLDPITDTLVMTTTTDADGGYLFAGLSPDKYLVDVTDANGVLSGLTHPLGPQSQPDPFAVTLAAGQT